MLAPDSGQLASLLTSDRSTETKAFVLRNSTRELLDGLFKHRDIDQIRELLSSFTLPDALKLTQTTIEPHSRKIIRNREVYEAATKELPQTIEHRYDDTDIPNHYAILGIPRTANDATIKRTFRLLSEMYHPDRFMNESLLAQEQAKERLIAINSAHEALSNREERARYLASLSVRAHLYPKTTWFKDLPSLE
jgi:DnaJ-domain-containing protein 1